jgi:hypothetical protein
MKQHYKNFDFRPETASLIRYMNGVITEYTAAGFRLTVRQLYYQLVARGKIENTERSYKRITGIVNDARLAGLMDWDAIEDRTREFIRRARWESGNAILHAVAKQFHMDQWAGQEHRVFVIVEKEALAGVLEGVCRELDVPLLAARGYPSGTVLREFAVEDLIECVRAGQTPVLLHLGDHDPSGIDMSRDLTERLRMFAEGDDLDFTRIALNIDQVEEQKPPPNPAKTTDSRFESYLRVYGEESWELDALAPQYLADLVRENAQRYIDKDTWDERAEEIVGVRQRLERVAETFT